jgi:8-oxo-dGTP diphosphatase
MNDEDFYKTLPRKRMAAGALFFDQHGNTLIVKPTYRDYWLLPGGAIEENESPRQGCIREVLEELGLHRDIRALLCIDYVPGYAAVSESLQFIFYGGILDQQQIADIVLPLAELSEYRFLPLEEAVTLVSPRVSKRLMHCREAIEQQIPIYLENGQTIY